MQLLRLVATCFGTRSYLAPACAASAAISGRLAEVGWRARLALSQQLVAPATKAFGHVEPPVLCSARRDEGVASRRRVSWWRGARSRSTAQSQAA